MTIPVVLDKWSLIRSRCTFDYAASSIFGKYGREGQGTAILCCSRQGVVSIVSLTEAPFSRQCKGSNGWMLTLPHPWG